MQETIKHVLKLVHKLNFVKKNIIRFIINNSCVHVIA